MIARNQVTALLVVAALAIGIALLVNSTRKTSPDEAVGNKVLPTLAAGLNDVSEVRITEAGNKSLVTLERSEDGKTWQVMERDGYRADVGKLRELLIKLSELQVVEVKTSNPASYPQIGVEDVDSDTATGKRIDIVGSQSGLQAPLGLILGRSASGSGHYVRVAGEAVSYLARPQITVYSEPKVWLDRALPALAAYEAVQEVRVSLADGTPAERSYTATREAREQTDFTVPGMPRGKKLSPGGANLNAGTLAELSFEDVRKAAADEKWDAGVSRAQFRLFDGAVITVLGRSEKNTESDQSRDAQKHYARFEVSFDESQHQRFLIEASPAAAQVRQKTQELHDRLASWVYEIPGHKYDSIFRPLDELVAKD